MKAGLAALARGPIDENYDPLSPLSGCKLIFCSASLLYFGVL